jgi:DNA polymerase-3 subunit chi
VTRVDFYILDRPANEARLILACRLTEKAVDRGYEILINTRSDEESARLNDLLWTFSQGSFLPHRIIGDDSQSNLGEPVSIGSGREPPDGRWDLLINLASEVPEFFGRFSRVAELVGPDESDKAAGRERFRYYRDRGYALQTHHI